MKKKYGCIGEKLSHSFSKEIHAALADYDYKIIEIPRDKLAEFATEADFAAINVTIPYKELIMPYLKNIDEHAKAIGAVNTVVNRNGTLYGYNTDFYGMSMLIAHAGISVEGKKVAILGTGGTSKTANAVCKSLLAKEIITVSRKESDNAVSYDTFYKDHNDVEILINTTPVGMYPNTNASPVNISKLDKLSGVIDAVYNPLCTELILSAKERGIKAEGGLYMLVAQGVRASEIFLDTAYPEGTLDAVYKKILKEKENIVLCGMPGAGKTTVGKILKRKLSRELIDTDTLIVEVAGKEISSIFAEDGEAAFRDIESDVICDVSKKSAVIISTGGGAILRDKNIRELRKNGKIYFIDRPLKALLPTKDRPLAQSRADIERRYAERYDRYLAVSDERIDADTTPEGVAERILRSFSE